MFQVPKGMLQTRERSMKLFSNVLSFKSPRECYKQFLYEFYLIFSVQVSSPQGNATNSINTNQSLSFVCVSSPQGNATNSTETTLCSPYLFLCFKSPRECYKLHILKFIHAFLFSFKSPRECYKLNFL